MGDEREAYELRGPVTSSSADMSTEMKVCNSMARNINRTQIIGERMEARKESKARAKTGDAGVVIPRVSYGE